MPLMFIPRTRLFKLNKVLPHKEHYHHFRVMRGMYIEGKTSPPVADATVTIWRKSLISLEDRAPKMVKTDRNGRFKVGPVHIDSYTVDISKQDYTFERVKEDSNDFIAYREARLEVQAQDSLQMPLSDVYVTLSSGKTVIRGQTDEHGSLIFSGLKT